MSTQRAPVRQALPPAPSGPCRRRPAAGVVCRGLILLACLAVPLTAAAQAPAGDRAAEFPGQAITQALFEEARSPFHGLFRPIAPATLARFNASAPGASPDRTASIRDLLPVFASSGAQVQDDPRRACPGCPPRRPLRAIGGTLMVNVIFNLANRLREPNDEFKVSFSSWWENLKYGFEWDYNSFEINQFGHPYQGNLYFNTGRANGLNFWESAPLAALGSATWEYFGEKNHGSINDFITTTMGGIALGEMFHRAAWMIRDQTTKEGRTKREILAMVLDPSTGINRFITGEAGRVAENPAELKPTSTITDFEAGVQFNGRVNERAVNSTGEPFLGMNLGYNDLYSSPYKLPFDAFAVTLRLGGGAGITEALVRGRLYGRFRAGSVEKKQPTEFLVAQAYDFQKNEIFEYGGQSVLTGVSHVFRLSDSTQLSVYGLGGAIVLGAIRSALIPETPEPAPVDEGEPVEPGHEVLRTYDFGPGAQIGGGAALRYHGFPVARLRYVSFYLRTVSSVEGEAGKHYAQVVRLDLLAPLWRSLKLGVSGDYINRATYYKTIPDVHQWIPQLRVYIAKVSR
jgi:hypothetical protein